MELLCPAGNLPALKTALSCGADAVYIGFKGGTNARHFPGLNFSDQQLVQAVKYTHDQGKKLHVALNTFAHPNNFSQWSDAVDLAASLQVDALIIADIALLEYAARRYPALELHLSVQASATNSAAIAYYQEHFNVKRVVLPRVLSIEQVTQLSRHVSVDLEVFAFGSLCIMAEGRCYLSSYLTGQSPNTVGACSPASHVRWQQTEAGLESRLNNILVDRYLPNEQAGYPTLCKGRFVTDGAPFHALEEPTSLNTLAILPKLFAANVASVKIEGRQRSSAYVEKVAKTWRAAIDSFKRDPENYRVLPQWDSALAQISEGTQTTLGAYHRKWQ